MELSTILFMDDHESVISSTGFKIDGNTNELFLDDSNGIIRTYYLVGTTRTYVDLNFGTVNYDLGLITIFLQIKINLFLMLMILSLQL